MVFRKPAYNLAKDLRNLKQQGGKDVNTQEAMSIMGLSYGYTEQDVIDTYKRLAKKCHPDVGGTEHLFRLVSEARDVLFGKGPMTPGAPAGPRDESGLSEALADSEFVCPLDVFLKAAQGQPVFIPYKGYMIPFREIDMVNNFVPARIPVTVEYRAWNSWFGKLFCRPSVSREKQVNIENARPTSKVFNATFHLRFEAKVKYFTVKFSVLGLETSVSGKATTARTAQSVERALFIPEGKLVVNATFKFS